MKITVGCCVPRQDYDFAGKLDWLKRTLDENPELDVFFLPQEWLGGHYAAQLAAKHRKEMPLHWERAEVEDVFGELARERKMAFGIGACIKGDPGATEDYVYFERDGNVAGWHRKFALPAYDDVRTNGAGRLWAETDYTRRIQPIDLTSVGLRVGTIFCWEIYARTIIPAYAFNDVNLIVHPIKFAPRGWLVKSKPGKTLEQVPQDMRYPGLEKDEVAITGFGQAAKSEDWIERLHSVAHFDALCPIAISCNTWDLGPKYMAITGHVDPFLPLARQPIKNISSEPGSSLVHTFEMNPKIYSDGVNNAFSAGAYKEAVGTLDGLNEMRKATMSIKMRRLEAHLIGDTAKRDAALKAATMRRQHKKYRAGAQS